MNAKNTVPERIREARAALDGVDWITVVDDWRWYEPPGLWALRCRLHVLSSDESLIPRESDWFVCVHRQYPLGRMQLWPAETRSITSTFHHQLFNGPPKEGLPWRTGSICSETSLSCMNRRAYDEEPCNACERLVWRLRRTCEWLCDAANGTLISAGDPFELPDYQTAGAPYRVVFSESAESHHVWRDRSGHCGLANLGIPTHLKGARVVLSFQDSAGGSVFEIAWPSLQGAWSEEREIGVWILFSDVIVLPPWQAPMTWGELLRVATTQHLNVRRLIGQVSRHLRDGRQHIALLGFPVPRYVGVQPSQIHWQALLLPPLSRYGDTAPGFSRPGHSACQRNDNRTLSGATRLNWQKSENWHATEILNRGMFTSRLTGSRVAIVGGGAIGSMIAEMIVRGGAKDVTIIDGDRIEIGNLARHTLSTLDIGEPKASRLASRLGAISPHVRVSAITQRFENVDGSEAATIAQANIVLDTTGSDDVLHLLKQFAWVGRPFLASVSVGLQARRLYVFTSNRQHFPAAFFLRHVRSWLLKDSREYNGGPLPISGGIGCWHPAFPARVDDMWLLASTAMRYIEEKLQSDRPDATLAVFEQQWNNKSYCGVALVREDHDNG